MHTYIEAIQWQLYDTGKKQQYIGSFPGGSAMKFAYNVGDTGEGLILG